MRGCIVCPWKCNYMAYFNIAIMRADCYYGHSFSASNKGEFSHCETGRKWAWRIHVLVGRVISSLLIWNSCLCLIFHLALPGQYKLWIVTSSDIGMSMLSEQTKTWSHGAWSCMLTVFKVAASPLQIRKRASEWWGEWYAFGPPGSIAATWSIIFFSGVESALK